MEQLELQGEADANVNSDFLSSEVEPLSKRVHISNKHNVDEGASTSTNSVPCQAIWEKKTYVTKEDLLKFGKELKNEIESGISAKIDQHFQELNSKLTGNTFNRRIPYYNNQKSSFNENRRLSRRTNGRSICCYSCQKPGHIAKYCKAAGKGKAILTTPIMKNRRKTKSGEL